MEKLGLVHSTMMRRNGEARLGGWLGCWRSWRAGGGPISPEGESQAWAEAETIQTGAESESGECGGDLQGVRCRGGRGAQEGALDPGALPLFGEESPAEGACTVRLIRVIAELFTGRPSSGLVNGSGDHPRPGDDVGGHWETQWIP